LHRDVRAAGGTRLEGKKLLKAIDLQRPYAAGAIPDPKDLPKRTVERVTAAEKAAAKNL